MATRFTRRGFVKAAGAVIAGLVGSKAATDDIDDLGLRAKEPDRFKERHCDVDYGFQKRMKQVSGLNDVTAGQRLVCTTSEAISPSTTFPTYVV